MSCGSSTEYKFAMYRPGSQIVSSSVVQPDHVVLMGRSRGNSYGTQ